MRFGQHLAHFLCRDVLFLESAEQLRRIGGGDGEEQPSGSLRVEKQIPHLLLDAFRKLEAA